MQLLACATLESNGPHALACSCSHVSQLVHSLLLTLTMLTRILVYPLAAPVFPFVCVCVCVSWSGNARRTVCWPAWTGALSVK